MKTTLDVNAIHLELNYIKGLTVSIQVLSKIKQAFADQLTKLLRSNTGNQSSPTAFFEFKTVNNELERGSNHQHRLDIVIMHLNTYLEYHESTFINKCMDILRTLPGYNYKPASIPTPTATSRQIPTLTSSSSVAAILNLSNGSDTNNNNAAVSTATPILDYQTALKLIKNACDAYIRANQPAGVPTGDNAIDRKCIYYKDISDMADTTENNKNYGMNSADKITNITRKLKQPPTAISEHRVQIYDKARELHNNLFIMLQHIGKSDWVDTQKATLGADFISTVATLNCAAWDTRLTRPTSQVLHMGLDAIAKATKPGTN